MLRLKTRHIVPPGKFQFKHPTTGRWIRSHNFDYLMSEIDKECAGNGVPLIDPSVVEHQICSNLAENAKNEFCASDTYEPSVDGVRLHANDIIRGTKTILTNKLLGEGLVDQEEAERRANICAYCPMNVQFRLPCGGLCGELLEIVESTVGNRTVGKQGDLHACAVCKCALPAKIWFPKKSLERYETDEIRALYVQNCWMRD